MSTRVENVGILRVSGSSGFSARSFVGLARPVSCARRSEELYPIRGPAATPIRAPSDRRKNASFIGRPVANMRHHPSRLSGDVALGPDATEDAFSEDRNRGGGCFASMVS